jgi:hypothetical protein
LLDDRRIRIREAKNIPYGRILWIRIRICNTEADATLSRVAKNPVFLKPSPVFFLVFLGFWFFLGFLGFFWGFFAQTRGFFQFHEYF